MIESQNCNERQNMSTVQQMGCLKLPTHYQKCSLMDTQCLFRQFAKGRIMSSEHFATALAASILRLFVKNSHCYAHKCFLPRSIVEGNVDRALLKVKLNHSLKVFVKKMLNKCSTWWHKQDRSASDKLVSIGGPILGVLVSRRVSNWLL